MITSYDMDITRVIVSWCIIFATPAGTGIVLQNSSTCLCKFVTQAGPYENSTLMLNYTYFILVKPSTQHDFEYDVFFNYVFLKNVRVFYLDPV